MKGLAPLTVEQAQIRDAPDGHMLITAPAGCGKTEAIALRAASLVRRSSVVAPRQILALTYSNRATENLRSRIAAYLPSRAQYERVTIQNFHGFSWRVVRNHGGVAGLDPDRLSYPNSDVAKQWVAETYPKLGYKESRVFHSELAALKQQSLLDDELLGRITNPVVAEFETWRQAESVLTYDDVPRYGELILRDARISEAYSERFPVLLVDEYQDLTEQMLRICQCMRESQFTFAGDLGQGIYKFAGAAPDKVHAFAAATAELSIALNASFRSSPAVVEVYNRLSVRSGAHPLTCGAPSRFPGGGLAAGVAFSDWEQEAAWVTQFASRIMSRRPAATLAILAPNRNRRSRIDAAFEASNVPHYIWETALVDPDVAQILDSLLSDMVNGYEWPEGGISKVLSEIHSPALENPSTRQLLVEGLEWLEGQLLLEEPETLRRKVSRSPSESLHERPGVHLLTGHAGKGLEFDGAFVIGMEDGNIPFFATQGVEEERDGARVLSVMISRARHGVVFTYSRSYLAGTGTVMRKPISRYRNDLGSLVNGNDAIAWFDAAFPS